MTFFRMFCAGMLLAQGCLVVSTQAARPKAVPYQNFFTEDHRYNCPENEVITELKSVNSYYAIDRSWNVSCGPTPGQEKTNNCQWNNDPDLDFVNQPDEKFKFSCQDDQVLSGIASEFRLRQGDRQYKFYCCNVVGKVTSDCEWMEYENKFEEDLNFSPPDGKVIKGVKSEHNNWFEDRRFGFEICELN